MRFVGLSLADPVPDAKAIWLFREQLVRAGAFERLFERFDAVLRERPCYASRRRPRTAWHPEQRCAKALTCCSSGDWLR
jgi:Transposase domain (DUF772)